VLLYRGNTHTVYASHSATTTQPGFAAATAQASLAIIGASATAQNRENSFRLAETARCDPNPCDDPNSKPAGKRSRMLSGALSLFRAINPLSRFSPMPAFSDYS